MKSIEFAASLCIMFIMIVVKNEVTEELNIGEIMMGGNDELLRKIFSEGSYKKALQSWLPFLNKRGYLDSVIKKE